MISTSLPTVRNNRRERDFHFCLSKDGRQCLYGRTSHQYCARAIGLTCCSRGVGMRWSIATAATYTSSNDGNSGGVFTEGEASQGQALSLVLNLPSLAVLMLRPEG